MKTRALSMIRGLSGCIFLVGSAVMAQGFDSFTREINLENGSLPQKLEIELPGPGHVRMEVVKFPKGATFFALFPKIEGNIANSDHGQASLVAGKHIITIKEKFDRKFSGPIHVRVVVTPENDPSEPNGTIAQARPVNPGATDVTVFPVGDVDYLKVNLKDRGYLKVYALDPPKGFTSHCEVYDFNNTKVGANNVRIEMPGEYTLKCMDRYQRFGITTAVKIMIEFHPEEDPAEPNDLLEDAAEIPLGVWQQALSAPASDHDFHALDIKSHGRIAYTIEDLDKDLRIGSEIYDSKGKKLQLAYPYTVKPGKYFVKIFTHYDKWSLKPYRLKFDLLPIQKITAPDEEKPAVIEPGSTYYTLIQAGSESDRFTLKLKKPSIVHARLNIPEGSDYRLSYHPKDGQAVTSNSLWLRTSDPELPFTIKPYYNKVSYSPLSVRTEVEEEFDPSEPNDVSADAAVLELEKPRMFFLYPHRDIDWFKVSVDEPGTYYVHVVQTSADSSMRFSSLGCQLHDATGKHIRWVSLKAMNYGFTSVPIEIKDAGDYHIALSSNGSSRAPLVVGMDTQAGLAKDDSDGPSALDVFVAGVELKPNVAKRMKNMVDSGGGEFVNAEKAEEISKKLVEISDQIDERSAAVLGSRDKKKKQSGMWWLLLLLLPAGAFAFIWFKKRYINDAQAWRILVGLD